ncbi:hypothetical protein SUDANB140_07563 (plasmid) [Streptomyces sp. enrichment culture]
MHDCLAGRQLRQALAYRYYHAERSSHRAVMANITLGLLGEAIPPDGMLSKILWHPTGDHRGFAAARALSTGDLRKAAEMVPFLSGRVGR